MSSKRVLVVGGGAAGLVCLSELVAAKAFDEVALFERRPDVGGVWFYEDPAANPTFPSPAYAGLVGNITRDLLSFSTLTFPAPADGVFPTLKETHDYLLAFAQPLRSHIFTQRQVVGVEPVAATQGWTVVCKDQDGQESTQTWDAVVIATGAFDTPYWPDIPGLAALRNKQSPLVMHAKQYRGPQQFLNQTPSKVLVLGNANSGNDIAAQLAAQNDGPLFRSIRAPSRFAYLPDEKILDVAPIAELRQGANGIDALLTDGRLLSGLTKVIIATGYQHRFDWIRVPKEDGSLGPASLHGAVPDLFASTFLVSRPTLSFVGLAASTIPFPLAEIQARCVTAVLSHKLILPSLEAMKADAELRVRELGLKRDNPARWREVHMIRGAEERRLTAMLLDWLGPEWPTHLFRFDEAREEVIRNMRAVKEAELRRVKESKGSVGNLSL